MGLVDFVLERCGMGTLERDLDTLHGLQASFSTPESATIDVRESDGDTLDPPTVSSLRAIRGRDTAAAASSPSSSAARGGPLSGPMSPSSEELANQWSSSVWDDPLLPSADVGIQPIHWSEDAEYLRQQTLRHTIRFEFVVLKKLDCRHLGDFTADVEFKSGDLVGLANFEKISLSDFLNDDFILDDGKLRVVLVMCHIR